ncbi:MAG TPA: hypothetical protein VK148_04615 [Xanthobacteraceae bacterium]|jgi:hypothetical protein|nr:hypothetical protein [Xanthobacteraceae bacterium]
MIQINETSPCCPEHLIKINAMTPNKAPVLDYEMEESMLDGIILFAIVFFALFGVSVLVVDWIQRRVSSTRR